MKKWIIENKNNIIIFTIYLTLTFILIFLHEAWRDEAQAWLISRDLNFIEICEQMRYEGHFLLWYLILMPFAKLGFPYITTNIISWIITSIAVWLMLKKAPFKAYKKVLFIFTLPMLYLFPIVSRCYCLIPLAVVLMAIFYKDRTIKPIRYILSIILLANTHIIMYGMVGVLLLEFYIEQLRDKKLNFKKENRKIILSLIITIILLMLSIIPLLGCLNTNKYLETHTLTEYSFLNMLLVQPIQMIQCIYLYFSNKYIIASIVIFVGILCFFEIKYNTIEFLKISIIFLWQYIIYAFIYGNSIYRAATAILIILFFTWTRKDNTKIIELDRKVISIFITLLLILNITQGILFINEDVFGDYSTAYKVGEYINKNIEDGSIMLVGESAEYCTSIIPYVRNVKFYQIQRENYYTFVTWDDINKKELEEGFVEKVKKQFGNTNNLYYVYCKSDIYGTEEEIIENLEQENILIKIFETNTDSDTKEEYIIYKMNVI